MATFSNLLLPPFTVTYSAVTRLRTMLYQKNFLRAVSLPAPVISIGNITTGGTGKTPLVEWVSRTLSEQGRRVCILTRGYKRKITNRVVVSDGKELFANVTQAGDEPYWLAQKLKGVAAVICDADRAAAGEWAIANLKSNAFVLDDGFQHLQLLRDLNILAIDATNPWGGGQLLPSGRLRESRRAISRADCVILTRTEQTANTGALQTEIKKMFGERPVFTSQMNALGIRRLSSNQLERSETAPQPVAAFCAVGNPESFFNNLRREGLTLVYTKAFPDHHFYKQSDIVELCEKATQLGAASVLTTAKDAVKLTELDFDLPCYVFEIEVLISQADKLRDLIRRTIASA